MWPDEPNDNAPDQPAERRMRPALMTTSEVAELFRRTDRTIRNWVRAGLLTPVRAGRAVFFREADVLGLLGLDGPRGDDADVADGSGSAVTSAGKRSHGKASRKQFPW